VSAVRAAPSARAKWVDASAHATGCIELHFRGIDIAEVAGGKTDEHAHARSVVRGLDLLPAGPGLAQNRERCPRVAFGQPHRPTRLCSHRRQYKRIEFARERREFVRR
jgi:hypothetical protein